MTQLSATGTDRGNTITGIVATVVGRLAPQPVPVADPGADLVRDLGYHSLALVELTFLIEELFALPPISTQEAGDIRTVADIADYLRTTLQESAELPDEARVAELLDDFGADTPAQSPN